MKQTTNDSRLAGSATTPFVFLPAITPARIIAADLHFPEFSGWRQFPFQITQILLLIGLKSQNKVPAVFMADSCDFVDSSLIRDPQNQWILLAPKLCHVQPYPLLELPIFGEAAIVLHIALRPEATLCTAAYSHIRSRNFISGKRSMLWLYWWNEIQYLRSGCSRTRTFLWFVVCVAGLTVRSDRMGVTSLVRALGLKAGFYDNLLGTFHSTAIHLDRMTVLWTQLVLKLFSSAVYSFRSMVGWYWSVMASRYPKKEKRCRQSNCCIRNPSPTPRPPISWGIPFRPFRSCPRPLIVSSPYPLPRGFMRVLSYRTVTGVRYWTR